MIKKIKLYINTIRYLKPKQVFFQLKRKVEKDISMNVSSFSINNCDPLKLKVDELDLDEGYLERFDVTKILKNQIVLLNEEYALDTNNWNNPKASHLWNFNLHYFEFAVALAGSYYKTNDIKYYSKFKELLNSWIDANRDIKGDAWQAYTISLRIPNLFICFDLFGEIFEEDTGFREKVLQNLYLQYQHLREHQELHLLGNHYFENLKTILICSLYFGKKRTYKTNILRLKKEMKVQILEDGLHFELSIMYHKIILEDIIRIAVSLRQREPKDMASILLTIQKMVDTLASLEKGMGKIPLFNDAGDGVAKESYQLLKATKRLFSIEPVYKTDFSISGYYKLYKDNIAIMCDAGKLGPDYMPGHGHCDALSFELSIAGNPVFVNSGTYQYQGELRNYFRSTEAHNTVVIGNQQQSEYWGEHRVARRIHKVTSEVTGNGISGSYENYLGNTHQRKIYFDDSDRLIIKDQVKVRSVCTIHSYLHLAPYLTVKEEKDSTYVIFNQDNQLVCTISIFGVESVVIHKSGLLTNYAVTFGLLDKKNVMEFQWNSESEYTEVCIDFDKAKQ